MARVAWAALWKGAAWAVFLAVFDLPHALCLHPQVSKIDFPPGLVWTLRPENIPDPSASPSSLLEEISTAARRLGRSCSWDWVELTLKWIVPEPEEVEDPDPQPGYPPTPDELEHIIRALQPFERVLAYLDLQNFNVRDDFCLSRLRREVLPFLRGLRLENCSSEVAGDWPRG